MHMQSNNDEKKNIDFLTHLQEKLPLNNLVLLNKLFQYFTSSNWLLSPFRTQDFTGGSESVGLDVNIREVKGSEVVSKQKLCRRRTVVPGGARVRYIHDVLATHLRDE